jgi:hypothetical protein
VLAEQLASLDIRDYVSLADLRDDLHRILNDYCEASPLEAQQTAFEPFYFCETVDEEVPLGRDASTLEEFRNGINDLSHASLQFHFLTSRLRVHLRTNDFSRWLSEELDLKELGRKIDQIDIYTNTLDGARDRVLQLVDREISR